MSENEFGSDNHNENEMALVEAARARVSSLQGEGNAITNAALNELGLMKSMLSAGSYAEIEKHVFWRMCSFEDEEEAFIHVAAYQEAIDLGMTTDWNIANLFALSSANRKIGRTSLINSILDAMSSFRNINIGQKEEKHRGGGDQKSGLSG